MREIRFRGKREFTGEWVEGNRLGCGLIVPMNQIVYVNTASDCIVSENLRAFGVLEETVGQYTGLKDKNGKWIFEGDILRIEEELWSNGEVVAIREYVCEVFFDKRDARFSGKGTRHREWLYNWGAKYREVIGNIYENPELLGGADV